MWFPVNYLIIESLQKFHFYLGDAYKVECPHGSGQMRTLWDVAGDLSRRLNRIFLRGEDGTAAGLRRDRRSSRPTLTSRTTCSSSSTSTATNGAGLGASHQTGWTGLVAKLIQQSGQ